MTVATLGHGNVRALTCRGRCQAQRQWMALRQALYRRSGGCFDAFPRSSSSASGSLETPQVQDLYRTRQLGRGQPAGDRRFATGEHHTGGIGKRRQDLAQPGVDQSKDFVVIDDDDRSRPDLAQACVQPFWRRALATQRPGERVVDPAVSRLERTAVELDDGHPGGARVVREARNQR